MDRSILNSGLTNEEAHLIFSIAKNCRMIDTVQCTQASRDRARRTALEMCDIISDLPHALDRRRGNVYETWINKLRDMYIHSNRMVNREIEEVHKVEIPLAEQETVS
jgi:hypothetical protein